MKLTNFTVTSPEKPKPPFSFLKFIELRMCCLGTIAVSTAAPRTIPNLAPSDVNTTLDGSAYPRWKIGYFRLVEFYSLDKNATGLSVASAATYHLLD